MHHQPTLPDSPPPELIARQESLLRKSAPWLINDLSVSALLVAEDPWGRPYVYEFTGREERPYELYTLGSDRRPGGTRSGRDLNCWDRSK